MTSEDGSYWIVELDSVASIHSSSRSCFCVAGLFAWVVGDHAHRHSPGSCTPKGDVGSFVHTTCYRSSGLGWSLCSPGCAKIQDGQEHAVNDIMSGLGCDNYLVDPVGHCA